MHCSCIMLLPPHPAHHPTLPQAACHSISPRCPAQQPCQPVLHNNVGVTDIVIKKVYLPSGVPIPNILCTPLPIAYVPHSISCIPPWKSKVKWGKRKGGREGGRASGRHGPKVCDLCHTSLHLPMHLLKSSTIARDCSRLYEEISLIQSWAVFFD